MGVLKVWFHVLASQLLRTGPQREPLPLLFRCGPSSRRCIHSSCVAFPFVEIGDGSPWQILSKFSKRNHNKNNKNSVSNEAEVPFSSLKTDICVSLSVYTYTREQMPQEARDYGGSWSYRWSWATLGGGGNWTQVHRKKSAWTQVLCKKHASVIIWAIPSVQVPFS